MSLNQIHTWLVSRIADVLNIKPEEVDTTLSFERYGLDSADIVGVMADLEDWLGYEIGDPTLMYEYPTIEELSQRLANVNAV